MLQVEVVIRPVEVRGHRADEVTPVLAAVVGAQLQAGDLGQRVALVRRLQRTGEQGVLAQRLRGVLGIHARAAEEEQLRHAEVGGGLDDVVLDAKVVEEELDLKGAVGVDAAHPRRREHDVRGPLLLEKRAHGGGVLQLQLRVRASDDPPAGKLRVVPQQRAACQPAMPCNENGFISHACAGFRDAVNQ